MPKRWTVRKVIGKPRYKSVFFAYMDILGFKNLVKKAGKDTPIALTRLFCEIDDEIQSPSQTGVHQRYLSDSILLWADTPSALPYLFEICIGLRTKLLQRGHLIRGVIVKGDHYSSKFAEWDLLKNTKYLVSDEVMREIAESCGFEV
jgi:hypothetical protein